MTWQLVINRLASVWSCRTCVLLASGFSVFDAYDAARHCDQKYFMVLSTKLSLHNIIAWQVTTQNYTDPLCSEATLHFCGHFLALKKSQVGGEGGSRGRWIISVFAIFTHTFSEHGEITRMTNACPRAELNTR